MNKIIDNKKLRWLAVTLIFFVFPSMSNGAILSNEDVIIPQGVDSIEFSNYSSSDGIVVKFKNNIDNTSAKSKANYVFKDSGGQILDGSSISCNNIDNSGKLVNSAVIGSTNVDYVFGVDSSNSVTISAFCDFPTGNYKLCVSGVKTSLNGHDVINDPMPETCVNLASEDKIIGVFPYDSSTIQVLTNFSLDTLTNKNYDVATNYIFKDSYGATLDGQNVSCYGNSSLHPNIDSNGNPTGTIEYPGAMIKIGLGCSLPINQYQLCVSNITDNAGGAMQREQCLPYSPTPRFISAEHVEGYRNKIKLTFDNNIKASTANGFQNDIVIKDLSGNILTDTSSSLITYNTSNSTWHPSGSTLQQSTGRYLSIDLARSVYYKDPDTYYDAILDPGTYKVCLSGIRYQLSSYTDTLNAPEQCQNVVIKDYTKPFLYKNSTGLAPDYNYYASRNKIIIKYAEPMGYSNYGYGAITKNNYMIKDYDSNGDGIADVSEWTSLSDATLNSLSIFFSNNNKDVNIELPINSSIGFLDGQTDIMIGNESNPNSHLIKDIAGNPFINGATYVNYLIGQNLLVNKRLDLSSVRDVKSIKIKSSTEIDVTFGRNIDSISANEFVIKNMANRVGVVPASATIDSNDKHVVKFIIPSGASNEFTKDDSYQNRRNIEISTKDDISVSRDACGELFLESTVLNGYMDVVFINDIVQPEIKSVKASASDIIMLEITGEILNTPENLKNLGDSLVLSQNVAGTLKSITNGGAGDSDLTYDAYSSTSYYVPDKKIYFLGDYIYYNKLKNTSVIYGDIGGYLRSKDFVLKTLPSSSITFVNSNNKKLKENLSGVVGSFDDFYANYIYDNLLFDFGTNLDSGSSIILGFNKNVDKNTIVSNGSWEVFNGIDPELNGDYAENIGCSVSNVHNNICYQQSIKNGVMFDGLTNKISFPGTNIGSIIDYNNIKIGNSSSVAFSDLYIVFNENNNEMILVVKNNIDVEIGSSDTIDYLPGDNLRTLSGQYINTNYGVDTSVMLDYSGQGGGNDPS